MSDCRPASFHAAATSCHAGGTCASAARPRHGALASPFLPLMTLLLAAALLLLFQAPALAHRVNIFAWTEGAQVVVKCGFNGGNGVKDGEITVYDATTAKMLFEGRTNAEGVIRFDIPPAGREHGLRIRINAGQGHQNEWQMEAAELAQVPARAAAPATPAEATPLVPENAKASQPASQPANSGTTKASAPISGSGSKYGSGSGSDTGSGSNSSFGSAPDIGSGSVSAAEVRSIVDAALDAQTDRFNAQLDAHLSPLRRQLAEMRSEEPGLREIVGGMGWLLGLGGLGLYFRSRRR